MQIFGRGIRRRLPPMLNNDRRWLELVYSLLFTLPGTPLLRYGDEIGMGDNLLLSGRTSVRTPMQWSDTHNGGFSTAGADQLTRPIIDQGEYAYDHVNVAEQQRDPMSLINWMERVIWMRKRCPEFGLGQWQILDTDESCIFAHACEWEGKTVMALHNLADKACRVTLPSNSYQYLIDLFGNCPYERLDANVATILLDPFGYRWFRVGDDA